MKNKMIMSAQWLFLLLALAVLGPAVIFSQIRPDRRDTIIAILLGASCAAWLLVNSPVMKYGFLWLLANGLFSSAVLTEK